MSKINFIQRAIIQLEGGAFQKLFDEYLYRKYKFNNIQTLGVQTGTNKPTKGTPDTYVLNDDGNYTLICYGTVSSQQANKIREDILSCFDNAKLNLPEEKIKKIICGHCSTNIHIEDFEDVIKSIEGVKIELIGIDTLSYDLLIYYPNVAKDMLGIPIDTNQFFAVEEFVKVYDANGMNAPINCNFLYRNSEITEIHNSIDNNKVTILTGPSGIGKTRLAVEVCRNQDDGITKVFCIKSNGNLLYEDIRCYISNPGKYLIFLDDANMVASLDNVINTIFTLSSDFDVRLLISIRDYAKDRVINTVSQYAMPNIIEIGRFKDDEVRGILKNNLGIVNVDYLEKITKIANGNIRLAVLAGVRSIDGGYMEMRDAEDIFKNYYGKIMDEAKLTKKDILMLFFVAIAGPVKSNENQLYSDIKNLYGPEIVEDDTIEYLYSLELVDWFKNEITKITDQSLGNYILYYVLIEKKWVSLEELISIGFPKFRNKIVYMINTLMEIFSSEECIKYVKNSIVAAWDNVHNEEEMEYLESFFQVNPYKALSIIKNYINQESLVDFDLRGFDINSKKNYRKIKTREIEILCGYKYTESYKDSVDLLICYFTKRPDLIMDFYFAISEQLIYDKESYRYKYTYEKYLLDKLWLSSNNGTNYNNSILYLYIVEYSLKIKKSFTEYAGNRKLINYVSMTINFTKEISYIRTAIWKNLAVLRKNKEYNNIVNDILLRTNLDGLNDVEIRKYFQSDVDVIYKYLINKVAPDFCDARIAEKYRKLAKKIGIEIDDRFDVLDKNQEFKIYRMLKGEHLIGRTIDEDNRLRKEFISREICEYNLKDFQKLFRVCKFLEKTVYNNEQWDLMTGLDCIFEIIECNSELYLNVLKEYFNENAPLRLNGYSQIKYMLNNFGYEETYCFVNNYVIDNKDTWYLLIWECIEEKEIDDKIIDDYKKFILCYLARNKPTIPSIRAMINYCERDDELKSEITKALVASAELSVSFLAYAYHDENIEKIFNLFRDNIKTLANIYIRALSFSCNFDYTGKLFVKIFEQQPEVWNKYVDLFNDNDGMIGAGNEHNIFELIWNVDTWSECVEYAFEVLSNNNWFNINEPMRLLFENTTNEYTLERKKSWLIKKLRENCLDIRTCKNLIDVVVNFFPDWKLAYILEYLKCNNEVKDFKKINLFPLMSSWSGSEIPLIMGKIDFLTSLNDRLKGIDYIDHRKYIEDYRMKLEKYKKEVELREYIEDID